MFTPMEARALVASVRMAQVWQDPALAQASQVALGKILSVLPAAARAAAQATLQTLREAAQAHRKVRVNYRDAKEAVSQRTLRPLGCFYWGSVWTLAAWCESRDAFRSFRLDRMGDVQLVDGSAGNFKDEPGKSLAGYLRSAAPPGTQDRLTSQ
jgi:predicted DNA-binding transcriptional regulator YafY